MTNTARLLKDLIALPSVNPAFVRPGDPHAGETSIAKFLAKVAALSGLDVEFQNVLPGRANIIARLSASGRVHQRILLAPHLDTVGAAEEQFKPRVRGGRLFGRGACDAKGPIAAMMAALCSLAESRDRPRKTEIIFAGLVDEENLQAGSRHLVASGLKADLAIVGEPTRLQIVTAHKGDLWLDISTRGKAAHGSRPELGRNAVHEMARIVDALETDYAAKLRRRPHPLLGPATVNVGTISGGLQPNIVPDTCSISIDRRTLPGETDAKVRQEIQQFLRQRGLKASFANRNPTRCPAMETDPELPLVRHFFRRARQRRLAAVNFFCDAAVLAEGGIPSVVFGPGDIAYAHTIDEWITLEDVDRAERVLRDFLKSLP